MPCLTKFFIEFVIAINYRQIMITYSQGVLVKTGAVRLMAFL